ncbi:MAG: hypothetical protein R2806_20410 [Saprospiraceae bacterium]
MRGISVYTASCITDPAFVFGASLVSITSYDHSPQRLDRSSTLRRYPQITPIAVFQPPLDDVVRSLHGWRVAANASP